MSTTQTKSTAKIFLAELVNLTLDQSMQPRFVEKDQKGLENPLFISAVIYSAYFLQHLNLQQTLARIFIQIQ